MDLRPQRPDDDEPDMLDPGGPLFTEVSGIELQRRAAQVGKAAGTAVAVFRDVRRRLREPGRTTGDRISELGATARTRVWELRREAAEHAEDWRQIALEKTADLRRQAKDRYETARERARQVGHDYPLHVVAAAGIAGFLIGAGLRIKRSHRGS